MSSFEVVSGVPVVAAPEEIDVTNADALRSVMVEAAAHGHGTLVVDMALTRFCDSPGIHTLLAAQKRAQGAGGELLLVIPDIAPRIFQITGIDRVIPNFASLEPALAQTAAASQRTVHPMAAKGPESSRSTVLWSTTYAVEGCQPAPVPEPIETGHLSVRFWERNGSGVALSGAL